MVTPFRRKEADAEHRGCRHPCIFSAPSIGAAFLFLQFRLLRQKSKLMG